MKATAEKAQPTAGPMAASTAAPLRSQHPGATAQRRLQADIAGSPQLQRAATVQQAIDGSPRQQAAPAPVQKKENKTGLPDSLKAGVENLSGHSLDDVQVHYNSAKPAQLQAHAYAQGTDIHVAPGQEQHLPHEAWHVVQQKQDRVRPTMQMKDGVNVNDDAGLENEADVMGTNAAKIGLIQRRAVRAGKPSNTISGAQESIVAVAQRVIRKSALMQSEYAPIQMSGGSSRANDELVKAMGKSATRVDNLPNAKPHTATGTGSGGGTDHQARNASVINKAKQDTKKAHNDPTMFSSSRMRTDDKAAEKESKAAATRKDRAAPPTKMSDYERAMAQAASTFKGSPGDFYEYLEAKGFDFTDEEYKALDDMVNS